jgi:hypothetical protein
MTRTALSSMTPHIVKNAPLVTRKPHSKGARVTWFAGGIQPHSSLWVTIQRFLLLNRPTSSEFKRDFFVDAEKLVDWPTLNKSACPIRLTRLARVLGESHSAFQWSYFGQYPRSVWPAFSRFAACRSCFREGFHSVLFATNGLTRCPAHDETLIHCDRCANKVSTCIVVNIPEADGYPETTDQCGCGELWMEPHAVRRPVKRPARDEILDELSNWIATIGHRCWFDLRHSSLSGLAQLREHGELWQDRLGLPAIPVSVTALESLVTRRQQDFSITHCGECSSAKRSSKPELGRASSPELEALLHGDGGCSRHCFKAIWRYLLRHTLRNGRSWISRLTSYGDADVIAQLLASGGEQACRAWTLILWRQSSTGALSLRTQFVQSDYDFRQRYHRATVHGEQGWVEDQVIRTWLSGWLTAMDQVQRLHTAAIKAWSAMTESDQVCWGPGVAAASDALIWSAARSSDGRVALVVNQRPIFPWQPTRQYSKAIRTEQWRSASELRFKAIVSLCARECLWYHRDTLEWKTASGPVPLSADECKRHRMLPASMKSLFVVFQWIGTTDPQRSYVARCLEFPLAATGPNRREAIGGLKEAAKRYLQTFGRPTTTSDGYHGTGP